MMYKFNKISQYIKLENNTYLIIVIEINNIIYILINKTFYKLRI